MDQDNGERPRYGVGIFPVKGTDTVRLVLDDLHRPQNSKRWEQWSFFTFLDIDREEFDTGSLSDEQCADIGRTLMARLMALSEVKGDKDEAEGRNLVEP